jgi:hypothetical protein
MCCNECCLTAKQKNAVIHNISSVKIVVKVHFRLIIYSTTSLKLSIINSQVDQSWLNNLVVLIKTSDYKALHNTFLVTEY